jgi:hypothetical protein
VAASREVALKDVLVEAYDEDAVTKEPRPTKSGLGGVRLGGDAHESAAFEDLALEFPSACGWMEDLFAPQGVTVRREPKVRRVHGLIEWQLGCEEPADGLLATIAQQVLFGGRHASESVAVLEVEPKRSRVGMRAAKVGGGSIHSAEAVDEGHQHDVKSLALLRFVNGRSRQVEEPQR